MTTMNNKSINWPAVISLGVLNTVFFFSSIAYDNYQPVILEKYALSSYEHWLEMVALFAPVLIPPIAGWLADRYAFAEGRRFLIINIGVTVTSLLFMCAAVSMTFSKGTGIIQALPYMMMLWLVFMNVFHSPSHSLLKEFGPIRELPVANAVIVLFANIIIASGTLLVPILNQIGAVSGFLVGGVILAASGFLFLKSAGSAMEEQESMAEPESDGGVRQDAWLFIVLCGLMYGLTRFFIIFRFDDIVGKELAETYHTSLTFWVAAVLIFSAIIAIPVGMISERFGSERSLMLGFGSFAILALLSWQIQHPIFSSILVLLLAVSMAFVYVNALPVALSKITSKNAALGTGLYWGAFFAVAALFSFLHL